MMGLSFDSLIFDMDGTLWDAVDTYAAIWNETYRRMKVDAHVTRDLLIDCMGMPLDKITDRIAPVGLDRILFERTLRQVDAEMMPRDGGRLYPGVGRLIPQLAKSYRLFMVSNCGPKGLDYFMAYTGLGEYFTDTLTHGQTHLSKSDNILRLISEYDLECPLYVGDTDGDCREAHAAGIPMAFVSYGFGRCHDADLRFNSFVELASTLLENDDPIVTA